MSGTNDLRHFLTLASAQIRNRLKQGDANGQQSQKQLSRLRLLEDLIKEQVPANANAPISK